MVVAWSRKSSLEPAISFFRFLSLFRHIVSTRFRSVRGASHQPAFMGSWLTINQKSLACLPNKQVRKFPGVTQWPGGEVGAICRCYSGQ